MLGLAALMITTEAVQTSQAWNFIEAFEVKEDRNNGVCYWQPKWQEI